MAGISFLKKLGFGVFVSVVGWFLVAFVIQPFLRWFSSYFNLLRSGVVDWFYNSIIQSAARGHVNDASYFFFTFLSATATAIAFGVTSFYLFNKWLNWKATRLTGRKQRSGLTSKFVKSLAFILMLIIVLISNLGEYKGTAIYKLIVTFHQQMAILAPFLSEEEEEILAAEWASMVNRQDYELIREKINSYPPFKSKPAPPLIP